MHVAVERIVETLRGVPPAHFQPGEVCARLRGILLDGGTSRPICTSLPTGTRATSSTGTRSSSWWRSAGSRRRRAPSTTHSGQLCWLSIQRGVLRLENFISLDGPGPGDGIRLVQNGGIPRAAEGALDLQQGENGIHRVSNPFNERAVSLHVYSRPCTTSASLTTPSLAPRARCGCSTTPSQASSSTAARSNCSEACRLAIVRAVRLRPCIAEEGGGAARPRSPGRRARRPVLAPVQR